MFPNPKICVVFNSGASGDFFASLVHQQMVAEDCSFELERSGAVKNSPGQGFKLACQKFFESGFDPDCFTGLPEEPVVNSHYCHQELLRLFPKCKFYYIDDRKFVDSTTKAFINKRLSLQGITALENINRGRLRQVGAKKMVHLDNDAILKAMRRDWITNCLQWESLGLHRINLSDIFEQESCRNVVKSIVELTFKDEVFTKTYIHWEARNLELQRSIKSAQ